ncbi:MAG: endonuclease III domain-containing protein [Desulfobacterales bacterium]|nr:endonuclease III domain-containing protein [Desulfobacterales bacterium]
MRVVRRPKPVEGIVAESFPLCHRKSNMQMRILVKEIYHKLFRAYGSMHWWPGETPFEVMVGALLTQNTSWKNVEKAIRQLKERGVLGIEEIHRLEKSVLASLIRPSGYFRIKADRLKALVDFLLEEYGGKLVKMKRERLETLRDKLLSVKGIGPETADSILLYALEKPIFVVDAYTKRILSRHGMIPENAPYGEVQDLFMKNLPLDEKLFNEYHALLVHLGKTSCKRNPKCDICPLKGIGHRA